MAKKPRSNMDRLEKIREKLKGVELNRRSGDFWSPKVGTNTIRTIPEVGEMEIFYQQVGKHVLPGQTKSLYCPDFTSEGELDCPVCELSGTLFKSGDKASKKLAKSIYVRRSFWMNVIVRDEEEKGPQIYTPGVQVFGALVNIINDPDYGDITDVDEGFDIVIEREGTGIDTKYDVRARRHDTPLHDDPDKIDEWLAAAKDLTVVETSEDPAEDKELTDGYILFVHPYNRILKEYNLDDIADSDDEDDYDDEDDIEDVEEEPAPRKRSRRSKVEDEDEDDEEEETPRENIQRRRARRSSRRSR